METTILQNLFKKRLQLKERKRKEEEEKAWNTLVVARRKQASKKSKLALKAITIKQEKQVSRFCSVDSKAQRRWLFI